MVERTPALKYEFIEPQEQLASVDFKFVENFLKITGRTQLGWHYITDLTWIYRQIKFWPKGLRVLDAGGGGGPVQFLLSELGFEVTNVDMVLKKPPLAYQRRYGTKYERFPSHVTTDYAQLLEAAPPTTVLARLKQQISCWSMITEARAWRYESVHDTWRRQNNLNGQPAQLNWCVGNLCHMPEFPAKSFDAVVSLSAIEHIPITSLSQALQEIHRIVKPQGYWAVTTSGTEQPATWLHEPSQGYCFSENDLVGFFGAIPACQQEPHKVLSNYHNCTYLKDNLAKFYKLSGKYGMPWGHWSPQYIPVGLSQ
ncbi:class I SAM-dependent methyltransferase [Gloeobacter kilaueensis]|uniref:Type 11 methyltransferase n=1 Tax=Gloeobacter kilaueensis (strain ATCC BAA-2537 / CCAP 1431/1 / ULC 316 / JS1) TaxID=1183438 RepID=U5QG15_GLOK1|nr:class I SAM-dependent methyltransferase [Gloeobacter kilaueensis]AGY57856.1 type 11 methyltransferase [Gloeobacter kilaueensis JS1]